MCSRAWLIILVLQADARLRLVRFRGRRAPCWPSALMAAQRSRGVRRVVRGRGRRIARITRGSGFDAGAFVAGLLSPAPLAALRGNSCRLLGRRRRGRNRADGGRRRERQLPRSGRDWRRIGRILPVADCNGGQCQATCDDEQPIPSTHVIRFLSGHENTPNPIQQSMCRKRGGVASRFRHLFWRLTVSCASLQN
jgi:hypothetical protein